MDILCEDSGLQLCLVSCLPWCPIVYQLVYGYPEGEDVAGKPVFVLEKGFWTHVQRRTQVELLLLGHGSELKCLYFCRAANPKSQRRTSPYFRSTLEGLISLWTMSFPLSSKSADANCFIMGTTSFSVKLYF